jgi:hypothetical protein
MTAEAPEIPDAEIRDWAKSTGRQTTTRGRVSDALRAEYVTELAGLHSAAPADPPGDDQAPRGPESVSKPSAARAEVKPRPVRPAPGPGPLAKARAWFNGATTTTTPAGKKTTTPKPQAPRPRTPITRLIETAWGEAAGIMEHVNIPVARTMAWQAPFVGIVADDVLKTTRVDALLQPLARAQTSLQGLGAMVAMPVVVGVMTSEQADPERHGAAAVIRQQICQRILVASIDAQLEMFGSPELAAKIRRSAEQTEARQAEVDQITGMIFASLPTAVEVPEGATAEDVADAQAAQAAEAQREAELRAAAAAVRFIVPAGPDTRGHEAQVAAAAMAQAGNAAAADEAAALAALTRP